jgi:hypothetical protein
MKTVTIKDFNFDIHEGSLGVYVSGGADSALLLYLLMKHVEVPLHIFSCGNGNTNYREPINALKIINKVVELTGNTNIRLHVHWEPNKKMNTLLLPEFMKTIDADMMYFGFTRPPPAGAIVDYNVENSAAVGGVDSGNVYPTYGTNLTSPPWYQVCEEKFEDPGFTKNYCLPFVNINKQKIAELYRELGIEELYKITRSCESLTIDDRHCGECWWCKERIWGFGYLD